MERKVKLSCVGAGVVRSMIITLVALLIYSAIITIVPDNMRVKAIFLMIITCISVLYGASYAAKKAQRKGWLTGVLVAIFYCLIIFIASVLSGKQPVVSMNDGIRMLIAVLIGALSGMLGINL